MIPNDNYTIVNIEKTKEFLFNKSYQEPNTGCWIWSGDSVKGGYGRACMRIRGLKRYYKNKNDRNRIK
jgi:hypothetical protein